MQAAVADDNSDAPTDDEGHDDDDGNYGKIVSK